MDKTSIDKTKKYLAGWNISSKWADHVEVTENPKHKGIELLFNDKPSHELQSKLRACGFRPSKVKNMWYSDNNPATKAFALDVQSTIANSVAGPDLALSPSFESTRANLEKKEFSFIFITLKDGQIKNYIVFEPSKPKAEVIAIQFSRQQFGDNFSALAAKPRTQLREARMLFDEGKIIFPKGQQTIEEEATKDPLPVSVTPPTSKLIESSADKTRELEQKTLQKFYRWAAGNPAFKNVINQEGRNVFNDWLKENAPEVSGASIENMWRSHERITKSMNRIQKRGNGLQPYSSIYKKLLQVIPDLIKHIDAGVHTGKSVKDPKGGLMDLHFDYLGKDKNGNYLIALSHYFKQNGDMVADPDMQIRILPGMQAAEAMTFQDQFGCQVVYPDRGDGKEYVDPQRKKELNKFLNQWLTNIIRQGHRIDLTPSTDETRSSYLEYFKNYPIPSIRFPEEEITIEQFHEQGFTSPFSAQEAIDKNLPVIDLAFRYAKPMEYFKNHIEIPLQKQIKELQQGLKNSVNTKDQRNALKDQITNLETEIRIAERLVQDESLIFQGDLFKIILEKARQKGYYEILSNDMIGFRDYMLENIFDNHAIENYQNDPIQKVIDELLREYAGEAKPETESITISAGAIATDIHSGDTFLPNVLIPKAAAEPFLSQNFQLHDMKSMLETDFPDLLKISDEDLSNSSALALFELLQMGHPSDYEINVYRVALLKEWEERGRELFDELGFPTDMTYPYVNLHTGYKSVESLGEILSDNNPEGDKWWAVAEHYRPIADVKKAVEIIEQLIKKQNDEKNTLINPKTNKPKLEYKHLVSDIAYAINSLEESKEVIQQYMDHPHERDSDVKVQALLANDSGVYTEETAGKNYEHLVIPMPKGAQYRAEIDLVKQADGSYVKGITASKNFGDHAYKSYSPFAGDVSFTLRAEALRAGLKEQEDQLQYLIDTPDTILHNEEKKKKQLTDALKALKEFANANDLPLDKNDTRIISGLEAAYWTKEDETYPQNKATIEDMDFDQVRLRKAIEDKLTTMPLPNLLQLAEVLSQKFKPGRTWEDYEKSYVTRGKTGDKRRAVLITFYVDDLIIHNDLSQKKDPPVMKFLIDFLFSDAQKLVDQPQHIEKQVPSKLKKQSQHELNQEIEIFVDRKDQAKENFSEEEKNYIRGYTGSGGLIHQGASGRGILYEYYTPEEIIKKMWDMAYYYGYDGGSVLEPAVGTGNFLKYGPKGSLITGYETNHYAARIAQVLYPSAHIYEREFESLFFTGNIHLKDDFVQPAYSLVIGNPPYGEFQGKYAGMGEKKWTGALQYEHYFTLRGLDVLKSGGILIYIVPSSFLRAASLIPIAKKIAAKCVGLDRYCIGTGVFKTTDLDLDIIALRKN
jgi:hypothetical protein